MKFSGKLCSPNCCCKKIKGEKIHSFKNNFFLTKRILMISFHNLDVLYVSLKTKRYEVLKVNFTRKRPAFLKERDRPSTLLRRVTINWKKYMYNYP